jgi:hypothetical protein
MLTGVTTSATAAAATACTTAALATAVKQKLWKLVGFKTSYM